jgi:hypothetical protein
VIAALIGWTQGFLRPVFAEASFALAVVIMALVHEPLLKALLPHLDVPAYLVLVVSTILLAFLINIPASRIAARIRRDRRGSIDRVLGVGLQLLSALIVISVVLITSDHSEAAVRPLLTGGPGRNISQVQVDAFSAGVRRDGVLSTLASADQLAADRAYAGTGRLTLDLLEQQHPWLRVYLGVRPAILASHLAPVLLRYGTRLPWLKG